METKGVLDSIAEFCKKNRNTLFEMPKREAAILEIASFMAVVHHYESIGFSIKIFNPADPSVLRVKTSTRGFPWNFSHVSVKRNNYKAEIHMNLVVEGAHDDGRYCVDVGIVKSGKIPTRKKKDWLALKNGYLLSFVEVKKLTIYPMLLAHFIGIVHELKPKFLGDPKPIHFNRRNHLPPALLVLGHYSSNSRAIVERYVQRGVNVKIAQNFDIRIASFKAGVSKSPIYYDYET